MSKAGQKKKGNTIKMYQLPEGAAPAIKALSDVTKELIHMTDRETQALAVSDMLGFAVLQNEKDMLADKYEQFYNQFARRIEEFRGTDNATLDKLNALQIELNQKSRMNGNTVEQISARAKAKTKDKTFTMAEAAKRVPLNWDVQRIAQESASQGRM